jgi:hypothetical protein
MSKDRQQPRQATILETHRTGSSTAAPAPSGSRKRPEPPPPTIVTLDEAAAAYEGEWALMRVMGSDPQTYAPVGEVLLHSPSRREIDKAHRLARKAEPDVELAIILGGTQRRSTEEFHALLDEAARGPYVNALW